MDRNQLETELAKIGYYINKSYNGNNDFIHNDKDEPLDIRVLSECIEINDHNSFGCHFYFEGTEVNEISKNCISICAKDNHKVFINLYRRNK